MPKKVHSCIWGHFELVDGDIKAKCNYCDTKLSRAGGGGTSCLKKHLQEFRFPNLAPLACKFLAAPPTSVPSEQLFSAAGLIYEPLRNRLKGDTVEKLLFLKYNLPTIAFKY